MQKAALVVAVTGTMIVAVAVVLVPGRWASGGAPSGDANGDGIANSVDAALLLQYAAGLTDSLAREDAADVNGDGTISAVDAALILQYDAGLLESIGPPTPPTVT